VKEEGEGKEEGKEEGEEEVVTTKMERAEEEGNTEAEERVEEEVKVEEEEDIEEEERVEEKGEADLKVRMVKTDLKMAQVEAVVEEEAEAEVVISNTVPRLKEVSHSKVELTKIFKNTLKRIILAMVTGDTRETRDRNGTHMTERVALEEESTIIQREVTAEVTGESLRRMLSSLKRRWGRVRKMRRKRRRRGDSLWWRRRRWSPKRKRRITP
jgi:hypothetical protein